MNMKKTILSLIMATILSPLSLAAQKSYSTLWKQVNEAVENDLPQTAIDILTQISEKAVEEQAYGQLMKAEMMAMQQWHSISRDSVKTAAQRLETRLEGLADPAAHGTMAAVLAKAYQTYGTVIADDWKPKLQNYKTMAMTNVEALAKAKAYDYKPLVLEGYNASVFDNDLLSVIGYETKQFDAMGKYYEKTGNRRAACIAKLYGLKEANESGKSRRTSYTINKSPYIYSLDSLINAYKDLDVAGEAAIERYYAMNGCKDQKVEKQITYIHYILENWPGWQRAGEMRTEERSLTNPTYQATLEQYMARPNEAIKITLKSVRNIKSVTANIYSTSLNGNSGITISNAANFKKQKAVIKNPQSPLVSIKKLDYHPNYETFDDSLVIEGLPTGIYVVELISQPNTSPSYTMLYVTDVFLLKQALPGNQVRYAVVSSATGKPLAGAMIDIKDGNAQKTLRCDRNGETIYKYEKNLPQNEYAYTEKDKAAPRQSIYSRFYNQSKERTGNEIRIMTDRAIYRPGQMVQMTAVCFSHEGWTTQAAAEGRTVKAMLRNANNKIIDEKTLTSDKYGTVTTSFQLPDDGLTDTFYIQADGSRKAIKVEEYKRPTFKVELPKVNSRYQRGDTLQLQGKAMSYAGVPVQGAKVVYRVERKTAAWWRWYGDDNGNELLKTAETITDGEGRFDVELPLELPDDAVTPLRFYNFVVTADVTDMSGETRVGTLTVPLGSRTTAISCDLGEKVLADSLKAVTISLKNAAGIEVSTDVKMNIDGGEWITGRTMQPISLPKQLASGRHTLTALCDSDTLVHHFTAFGLDDKVPCVETDDWFYCSSDKFSDDGEVTIQAGSSNDTRIFYSIVSGDKVLEQGAADKNNALLNRKLRYKKEYGNGVVATFAWVHNGKCYKHVAEITRPMPDKRLTLKWTTFRDRLLPGQQEQWQLNITRPDGKPADARLMATMYDKSLDQIIEHKWSLDIRQWLPLPSFSWASMFNSSQSMYMYQEFSRFASHEFEFSHFDQTLFNRYSRMLTKSFRPMLSSKAMAKNEAMAMTFDTMKEAVVEAGSTSSNEAGNAGKGNANDIKAYDDSTPQDENIRENLSETAFFYPMLTTDANGTVSLSFTLPETLTSWRMMGVANTTDMMTGYIEGETVAQKEVMVQPNLPRFLRTGDETQLSAKIFNTGNTDIEGTVKLELIDPETDKVVATQSKSFCVAIDKTTTASFDYKADDKWPLLIVRIVASGTTFSDGEQHYIAVLPEKELVTVTKTFTQTKPGTTTIDIHKMFDVKDNSSRMTIEYTNNAAWLMVQALPQMAQPHNNNAIDQAASLYANTLAQYVARNNPDIMKTFRLWKEEKAGEGSLTSNLEKNLELKDILLSETPWMNDAKTESEQKHALAMLFDTNSMEARLAAATDKLQKLQNEDGSWSWWPGMNGNTWMTQAIATIMARMKVMTDNTADNAMLTKAMDYLDKAMAQMVTRMKDNAKNGVAPTFPGTTALEYLYTNAILDRKLDGKVKTTVEYLIPLLKKESKDMSMFAKAMAAIILDKHGEARLAKTYVKSIVEHTVCTEADGRYFDSYRAASSWRNYTIPTQTAAIEAISAIGDAKGKDSQTIDEMKRWLLQQKRTQTWDTPVNSIDAIYAFMLGNEKALATKEQATVIIDQKTFDMPKATAGIGYQKATTNYNNEKKLTVKKTSEGTSWGSVYAQFMQDAVKVSDRGEGMTIKREMILPAEGLKVGARIKVRITIDAQRNMDFVEVIDRRASCMEPIEQLSGYRNRTYCMPKDNATYYFFDNLSKGRHVIETEYFIDREGTYDTGTCTVQCAYSPEFKATVKGEKIIIEKSKDK